MYPEPPLRKPKLRIGVLLDTWTVDAWQAKILGDLVKAPYLHVALTILNRADEAATRRVRPSLKGNSSTALYRLYQKIDRRLFQAEEKNAFAKVNVQELLSGAEVYKVAPIRKKYVDRFEHADIEHIKTAELDVLLRFGFRIIKGEILRSARFGVWSFHHDDSRYYRGGPPLFWQIHERNPVSGTILQILDENLDGGRILYRSHSATNFTSLHRSQNSTYWKTADFVIRRLRQLYASGWDAITRLDTYNEVNVYNKPNYVTPSNGQMCYFLGRQVLLYLKSRIASHSRKQWFLGIQTGELKGEGPGGTWDIVRPPRDRFYADPFLFSHAGRKFMFFESYSYRRKKGSIACLEIDGRGSYSEPVTVLEQSYHLSYPFVFACGSDIFMMPESSENGTVEVYRAVEFPGKWELHKVLLSNVMAVDPTLLAHEGKFWLFVNMAATEGASINDELFLFRSDSPFGPWLPHAQNPVVSDVCSARPAGRIFEQDGRWIRPSQDCSLRYGYKIKLNCIELLTPTEYKEREIGEIGPSWMPGNLATHCIAREEGVQVIDGCKRIGLGQLCSGWWSLPTILTGRARRRGLTLRLSTPARRRALWW